MLTGYYQNTKNRFNERLVKGINIFLTKKKIKRVNTL